MSASTVQSSLTPDQRIRAEELRPVVAVVVEEVVRQLADRLKQDLSPVLTLEEADQLEHDRAATERSLRRSQRVIERAEAQLAEVEKRLPVR